MGDARVLPQAPDPGQSEADELRLRSLRGEVAHGEAELKNLPTTTKVYAVVPSSNPPVVRVQRRGNPEDELQEVTPGAFAWARHAPADFGTATTPEGQRRRALAEWITHPDNPLTYRVMANRLWHHHFGQGIVATPSDFGLGGDRPSHPELLDFLATELRRSGGSLKHLHRIIVRSAAYRQQSGIHPARAAIDGSNRLLSRQNSRRLDAESTRDAVLSVSGALRPQGGGPGYRDFVYTEAYAPIYTYPAEDHPDLCRRTIYRWVVRTTPQPFLSALDCPDPANLTPVRAHTTTAL